MARKPLIVITGPIGSGKSTLAQALAKEFRTTGHLTAVIDLDLVWFMVRQRTGAELPVNGWPLARRATALLANTFFDAGLEIVIVEGPFGTKRERDSLCLHLAENIHAQFVTLRVSFDEAWRRIQGDTTRRPDAVSRDHAFLARTHAEWEPLFKQLEETDLILDAEAAAPDQLARLVFASVDLGPVAEGET